MKSVELSVIFGLGLISQIGLYLYFRANKKNNPKVNPLVFVAGAIIFLLGVIYELI